MIQVTASLCAAIAIAAGAFGAHGAQGQPAEWLKTGSFYLIIHAIAVLSLPKAPQAPLWCLLVGAALFALTLYAMAFGAPRWLGAVTPLGGVAMIIGWLWLGWQFWRG